MGNFRQTIGDNKLAAGCFVLAAALSIVTILWWLIPGNAPISARQAIEDACAGAEAYDYADIHMQMVPATGEPRGWTEFEASSAGIHLRNYHQDGTFLSERIIIWSTPIPSGSGAAGAASDQGEVAFYDRKLAGENQWGDWEVTINRGRLAIRENTDTFCSHPLDDFSDFQYLGQETVNGVRSRHFSGVIDADGDPDNAGLLDQRWDFWIGLNGRPVRHTITNLHTGSALVSTYSGYGEVNVIAAPVLTPTPAP